MTEREKARRDRRTALAIVGSVGALMMFLLAAGAFLPSCRGHGHGFGNHHGFEDVSAAKEHVLHGAGWALSRLDATDEQRDRVAEIIGGSVEDLYELRTRHREHHEQALALFTGPEIDRPALESLRAAEIELADAASQRLVQALADVAEVLTPEQRTEVREWVEDHHH